MMQPSMNLAAVCDFYYAGQALLGMVAAEYRYRGISGYRNHAIYISLLLVSGKNAAELETHQCVHYLPVWWQLVPQTNMQWRKWSMKSKNQLYGTTLDVPNTDVGLSLRTD